MAAGKRTFGGLVDDGVKSGVRYILNNFFDGHKQDALDLFTGTYVVKKGADLFLFWLQSACPPSHRHLLLCCCRAIMAVLEGCREMLQDVLRETWSMMYGLCVQMRRHPSSLM